MTRGWDIDCTVGRRTGFFTPAPQVRDAIRIVGCASMYDAKTKALCVPAAAVDDVLAALAAKRVHVNLAFGIGGVR